MVFVTSGAFNADLGGVRGADTKCQNAADNSAHPRVRGRRFVAWVSTSLNAGSPIERFAKRSDWYVLPNGSQVAQGWAGLVDSGPLKNPIEVTEDGGEPLGDQVWTGTNPNGTPTTSSTCKDWTSADPTENGAVGKIHRLNALWTYDPSGEACAREHLLYCFEQ